MYNYEDLNYEINEIFNYMIKNPTGTIEQVKENVRISQSDVFIVINLFHKSDIIMRYKSSKGSSYSLKKKITPVSFGKAINIGIDIDTLEKYFELENSESLHDLTYFIASGDLEKAIIEEEENKKKIFIENISEKCKTELVETAIYEHITSINNIIEKQKEEKNNDSVINLLSEISEELGKEFEQIKNKMIEKRISSLR